MGLGGMEMCSDPTFFNAGKVTFKRIETDNELLSCTAYPIHHTTSTRSYSNRTSPRNILLPLLCHHAPRCRRQEPIALI